jgi:hypothetical protein
MIRSISNFAAKPKLAAISVFLAGTRLESLVDTAVFRYSAPWRRVTGLLYPETRANLSRANFAARNSRRTGSVSRHNQEHPVVLPQSSHLRHRLTMLPFGCVARYT